MIILYKLCIIFSGIYACARIFKFLLKQAKRTALYTSYCIRRDAKALNAYLYCQNYKGLSIVDDPHPNKKYRALVYQRSIKKGALDHYVLTNYNNSKKVSAALYIKPGINGI
jgi:hypothetical protein